MRKLKIGFIGCGGIALAHAERLSSLNNVELTAFSDIQAERAKGLAAKYGGEAYLSWREMLKREQLDAVFICLPPFAHEDEVEVAAEKGIHVYIEKPIALDMAKSWSMVRAVEKHGVKSQVGYQMRFSPAAERVKALIDSGAVGRIGLATGSYWCRFIRTDWWIDRSKSGGQIVEQATHLYDILRWLCGDARTVFAFMDRLFWNIDGMSIEDTSGVLIRFKSGAIGLVSSTIGAVPDRWWFKWSIVGSDATLVSDSPEELTVYYASSKPARVETFREQGRDLMLMAEMDFINAILEDRPTRIPIVEGAKTLQLTLAAVKSAEIGRPVDVEYLTEYKPPVSGA